MFLGRVHAAASGLRTAEHGESNVGDTTEKIRKIYFIGRLSRLSGQPKGTQAAEHAAAPNKNVPRPEQHRARTSRNKNSPQPERHRAGTGRTETARSRNNTERERAEQKQPAAVTTPSGNEPKQKQPAAGTTPSGNEPKQKRPAAGTAPSGNGTNRNSPRATEGGGPSFGRHAQGIYRSATRCRGVLSGTTGESSSSSSSSMSVTSRPVSTPSV